VRSGPSGNRILRIGGTEQKKLFDAIDGKRTISEIAPQAAQRDAARVLFEEIGWCNQIAFDTSRRPGHGADSAPLGVALDSSIIAPLSIRRH